MKALSKYTKAAQFYLKLQDEVYTKLRPKVYDWEPQELQIQQICFKRGAAPKILLHDGFLFLPIYPCFIGQEVPSVTGSKLCPIHRKKIRI